MVDFPVPLSPDITVVGTCANPGAGKSVCYQVPAAVLPGLSIVVSPLISLMGDQVRALKDAGIRGSYLNSSLTVRQQEVVMARAMAGWYDLM